ncbi:hypothetical protein [Acinetobacter nosocomialis]|uniref:hypothetical protein n=1 Tax=Acinetobacter nosocomialis TaxID=106654 RepID=UPI00125E7235|nr:hypothetical protein [Acinetobacter nosocomialis]
MKPEQFIREFGVEKARDVVAAGADTFTFIFNDGVRSRHKSVSVQSLKRLVELLRWIDSVKGVKGARQLIAEMKMINCPVSYAVFYPFEKIINSIEDMEKAVAVHESIYGGSHES